MAIGPEEGKNFEFKPAVLYLEIDPVSHLVNDMKGKCKNNINKFQD